MSMKKILLIAALSLTATLPALAQFPPPGVYQCVDMNGTAFGTLTLQVAGDYQFDSQVTVGGGGQVASSGNSVSAVSGPLADLGMTGSFNTDAQGEASFMLSTSMGSVLCALPQ